MMNTARRALRRLSEAQGRLGAGTALEALDSVRARWGALSFVHIMELEAKRVRVPDVDVCFRMQFLTPEQVRRFAANSANDLPRDFVDRAERGWDLCYGAIHGDRLASYGWYALHSVEAEHSAGTPLGLPRDMAYLYKGYTHPDFRGQKLYGACMGWALRALEDRYGIGRMLAFVEWNDASSLRSCLRLGYDRWGLLVVGPRGPVRVPREARRRGVTFGEEAEAAVRHRLLDAPAVTAKA